MDNTKEEANSSQVVIQSYDPNNMDPQELATLLEQTGGASDEGCVQIVDGDGNLITITAAQLESAGIDLANINESDVETLLQLANQNDPSSSNVDNSPAALVNSSIESPSMNNNASLASSLSNIRKREADDAYADSSTSAKMAKIDDGGGTNGVETSNILNGQLLNGSLGEITELDPETLASLMQNGAVKFVDEQGNEIPASAILSSASGDQSLIIEEQSISDAPNLEMMSANEAADSITVPTSTSPPKTAHNNARKSSDNDIHLSSKSETDGQISTGYALIGALVDVKRAQGHTDRAIVRYVRPGVGYKVQFQDDNHFEWVNESQIIPRPLGEDVEDEVSVPNGSRATKSHPAGDFENAKSSSSGGGAGSRSTTSLTTYAGRRTNSSSSSSHHHKSITSPTTPKNCATFTAASSAAVAAAKKSMCAAAHDAVVSSAAAAANEESGGDAASATENTNFVCPVCEKKIYNKQPAYIVIRLPACDTCAESKILVLDDAKRP